MPNNTCGFIGKLGAPIVVLVCITSAIFMPCVVVIYTTLTVLVHHFPSYFISNSLDKEYQTHNAHLGDTATDTDYK